MILPFLSHAEGIDKKIDKAFTPISDFLVMSFFLLFMIFHLF